MPAPTHAGIVPAQNWRDAMIDQHGIDIIRLWRRISELGGSGFAAKDADAYNISQQFTKYVKLGAAVYSGSPLATSTVQTWDANLQNYVDTSGLYLETVDVSGFFMGGYSFSGEYAWVDFDIPSQLWLVRDNGHHMVRGTLSGTLTNGGSQTVTLARGGTVTGYEVLGITTPIASGKKVWLTWNKDTSHWEVVSAQC